MKVFKKKGVWASALVFALVLVSLLSGVQKMSAAGAVETDRACSVAFELENVEAEYAELANLEIPVRLFRIADMDASGKYKAHTAFGDLDFSGISADTTAEDWSRMAQSAAETVQNAKIAPDQEVILNQAGSRQDTVSGLAAGMYLVLAEEVNSPEYTYAFTPYLISLPNNYYYDTKDDTWVYDVTADLKPDQSVRYGDLEIVKSLSAYNQTLGTASFVFQVEAEKDGKTVYSNAVAISFDAVGTKTLTIEDLPAGAQVTVTEVYSGANCSPSGSVEAQATIVAEGETGNPARVSFENEYNGRPNSGTALVNHFTYTDGTWDVTKQPDSTVQQ